MAIQQINATVTDVAKPLVTNGGKIAKMRVYVANTGSTDDLFIGNSSVTSANGYSLGKFQSTGINNRFQIDLFSGDTLFGICASGKSTTVAILIPGN
jgi:hypothetical protein